MFWLVIKYSIMKTNYCFYINQGEEKYLKFSNKLFAVIAMFLITSFAISLVAIPAANAHTPHWTITDRAYIALQPNPIGVGQTVYITIWTAQPMADSALTNNIRKHNYTLTIKAPDGTTASTQHWDVVDNTGGELTTLFTPSTAGNYTATFDYGGQTYPSLAEVTSTVPLSAAETAAINTYAGDIFTPGTETITFTVQEEQLPPPINSYPLPTEYWTRPIEGQNIYWYTVSSNWLASAYLGTYQQVGLNLYQPDGTAPNTGHIMWTLPIEFGGVAGGSNTAIPGATYYSGSSYEGRFANTIIMNGYLYTKLPQSDAATAGGAGNTYTNAGPYVCIDLRTGQTIWQNPTLNPTWGQLLYFSNPNQAGVLPSGYLWQASGRTWICYSGFDGSWLFNITDVPSGTMVYDSSGNLDLYVLNYDTTTRTGWLALWNMTDAVSGGGVTANLATGWRPVGRVFDGSLPTAYEWNVTIPANLDGLAVTGRPPLDATLSPPSIYAVFPGDVLFGTSSALVSGVGDQYTPNPYTMWALNLNASKGTVGQALWVKNYTAPELMSANSDIGGYTLRLGPVDPTNRVITMHCIETFQWQGYSLDNGNLLWGPTNTPEPNAYQYFGGGEGGGQRAVDAYGNIYVQGYGGIVRCYDTSNGNLLWTFGNGGAGNSTNDGLNSPWGLLPIFIAAVADGKVYAFNNQHGNGAQSPYYLGEKIYCLNATTGEQIWSMMGMAGQTGGRGVSTSVLADGFFAFYNYYDNQIYSVGKGPSATTISALPKVSVYGDNVFIEGTVMDIAAGTKQNEQAARFPDGVPAVSDASMSEWMEYVYMQKPRPANATGVEVTLSVVDSNNNCRVIGTTTSDADGFFSYEWKPDIPGKFTVYASFDGSESYWPSQAVTAFTVDTAPAATPPPTPPPTSNTDAYVTGFGIAIIIAIAIVGVLLLRKH
jgi:outer membrane protein assembly factor BamB